MSRLPTLAVLAFASFASLMAADTPAADPAPVKPYTLTTCIVSDEALDSMGGPVVKVYEGQEVKFCCKGCIKKFEKGKVEYLKKLEAPVTAPAPTEAAPTEAAPKP